MVSSRSRPLARRQPRAAQAVGNTGDAWSRLMSAVSLLEISVDRSSPRQPQQHSLHSPGTRQTGTTGESCGRPVSERCCYWLAAALSP
jgi:hypothetical protein